MSTTTHAQHNAMKLKDGFPGISKRVAWLYRDHVIMQVFRTHDVRNKTHKGFDWYVNNPDGIRIGQFSTRKDAKARIDIIVERSVIDAAVAKAEGRA